MARIEQAEKALVIAETAMKKAEDALDQAAEQYRITCETAEKIRNRAGRQYDIAKVAFVRAQKDTITAYKGE